MRKLGKSAIMRFYVSMKKCEDTFIQCIEGPAKLFREDLFQYLPKTLNKVSGDR